MNPALRIVCLFLLLSHAVLAQTPPPFMEHKFYELKERCFNIAVETLNNSGIFNPTNTYGKKDEIFATYKQYKASIKCINLENKQLAVFSVAGVSRNNKLAAYLVEQLKKLFIGEEKKDKEFVWW